MFPLASRQFVLAKVGLLRAACPRELEAATANRALQNAIVIVSNEKKVGRVATTGYVPTAVIVAGAARRGRYLDAGVAVSWAFIEAGCGLEIRADHAIGSNELMAKLGTLVSERYGGALCETGYPGGGSPWVQEVYPFENYLIYNYKGQKYRQAYSINPTERDVALSNGSTPVEEKFVNAAIGHTGYAKESMSRVQTGVRYAWAPARGATQSFTTGGKDSELVTMVVRDSSDVLAAVAAYLDYIRTSQRSPMKPTFAPVSLTNTGKILAQLAAGGAGCYDFVAWLAGTAGRFKKKKLKGKTATVGATFSENNRF